MALIKDEISKLTSQVNELNQNVFKDRNEEEDEDLTVEA